MSRPRSRPVDERAPQAAGRGIERDPCSGDATADYEHVERLVGEPRQRDWTVEGHGVRLSVT